MHFPRFTDDHPHVLIVRGDGFPCGARSWCQIACGFANHMQKARTLLYNWTLDLALVSEHETDLVRVLFGETLKKYNKLLTVATCCSESILVRTVVIIGGDSPWLRHILGLSSFYEIGSIYSFATWCREKEGLVGCEWRRSTRLEAKFLKYRKQGVSCVGAKGCIESPLLKVDDRIGCVIRCVLHLVIRCGEYLTTFVRTRATMLTVPQRSKVQSLLKDPDQYFFERPVPPRWGRDMALVCQLVAHCKEFASNTTCHHYGSGHGKITNGYLSVDI